MLGSVRAMLGGVPGAIDTDVNAAALAEARLGAGAGTGDLAYVTVGTGIGIGLVVNGAMVHGASHPDMARAIPRGATSSCAATPRTAISRASAPFTTIASRGWQAGRR